ncbi:unnamed protein product [Vicia faba]|uniref:Uncharacterized protein n=1 Tax=Vicia faba TaxID=3906 RepID=A0AAV0YEM4_VICFA|nr:unnamed protein product [Vicia faba]
MSTYVIYFECAKERVLFLYHNLDLISMVFLNVIHGNKLVDEETMASLEFGDPSSLKITQGEGEHCFELHCLELQWFEMHLLALHFLELQWFEMHWLALHCLKLQWFEMHWLALHCLELHWFEMHWLDLHFLELQWFEMQCLVLH